MTSKGLLQHFYCFTTHRTYSGNELAPTERNVRGLGLSWISHRLIGLLQGLLSLISNWLGRRHGTRDVSGSRADGALRIGIDDSVPRWSIGSPCLAGSWLLLLVRLGGDSVKRREVTKYEKLHQTWVQRIEHP